VATLTADDGERRLRAAAAAVEAGAGAVQLRIKQVGTEERRHWLARARTLLGTSALLLINDDLEAVFDEDGRPLADGVHLGREDAAALARGASAAAARRAGALLPLMSIGLAAARERLGAELLMGTSTRTLTELDAAIASGADHAGFGAMAPSPTKPDTVPADPRELARCVAAHPDFPIFPIGGLDIDGLSTVLAAGCRRAAVGAAILHAGEPAVVAHSFLERLQSGSTDRA
jgi:thiamine monophosphate synthase